MSADRPKRAAPAPRASALEAGPAGPAEPAGVSDAARRAPESAGAPDAALLHRLAVLEREVASLRGLLPASAPSLPQAPFDALEVDLGALTCALPLAEVAEVVSLPWCDPVPGAADWHHGTFSFGGELVPVMDLTHRLTGRPLPRASSTVVVVLGAPATLGLLVQRAERVFRVDPHGLRPPDRGTPGALGAFSAADGATIHVLSAAGLTASADAAEGHAHGSSERTAATPSKAPDALRSAQEIAASESASPDRARRSRRRR